MKTRSKICKTVIALSLVAAFPSAKADILLDAVNKGSTWTTTGSQAGTNAQSFLVLINNTNGGATSFVVSSGHTLQENNSTTFYIDTGATVGTIDNQGTILGNHFNAIGLHATASIGTLTNSGIIRGQVNGFSGTLLYGQIGTFQNSGTIEHTGSTSALIANNITTLTNTGTIQSNTGHGVYFGFGAAGTVGTFTNSGTIKTNGAAGVEAIDIGNGTNVTSLTNTGIISNAGAGNAIAISANATVTELTNRGTITGGITNSGTITTLNNSQNNLAYTGALPVNYNIIISSASSYGKLVVSTPSGAMKFGVHSSSAASSGVYASVVSGVTSANFFALTGNSGAWRWTLSDADANNAWDLTLGGNVYASTVAQSNYPAMPAATVINQNDNLINLFSNQTTEQQVSDAISQTLPLLVGGSQIASSTALNGIDRVIQARIESNRGLSSGDTFYGDKKLWMKPFGSWADQDNRKGVAGYDAKTAGIAFGADATISDKTRLGIAFAYAKADINGNSHVAPNSAKVDVYQLLGYGSYSMTEDTEVNFQTGIGQNRNEGKREILFTNQVAKSEYDSLVATLGAGIARTYKLSAKTSIIPSVRANYRWIDDDGYTEKGADLLNLNVKGRSTDELILAIDGKVTREIDTGVTLNANLGLGYDLLNSQSSITSTYAGAPGSAFTTKGLDPEPWMVRGGLGMVIDTANGMEITAKYDVDYRKDFLNQTASVKLRRAF